LSELQTTYRIGRRQTRYLYRISNHTEKNGEIEFSEFDVETKFRFMLTSIGEAPKHLFLCRNQKSY